jgi:hypothetical protein
VLFMSFAATVGSFLALAVRRIRRRDRHNGSCTSRHPAIVKRCGAGARPEAVPQWSEATTRMSSRLLGSTATNS